MILLTLMWGTSQDEERCYTFFFGGSQFFFSAIHLFTTYVHQLGKPCFAFVTKSTRWVESPVKILGLLKYCPTSNRQIEKKPRYYIKNGQDIILRQYRYSATALFCVVFACPFVHAYMTSFGIMPVNWFLCYTCSTNIRTKCWINQRPSTKL